MAHDDTAHALMPRIRQIRLKYCIFAYLMNAYMTRNIDGMLGIADNPLPCTFSSFWVDRSPNTPSFPEVRVEVWLSQPVVQSAGIRWRLQLAAGLHGGTCIFNKHARVNACHADVFSSTHAHGVILSS